MQIFSPEYKIQKPFGFDIAYSIINFLVAAPFSEISLIK